MVNRSMKSYLLATLGGLLVGGITAPAIANPVSLIPGLPAPAPDKETAQANYDQNYQAYTELLGQVTSINQFRDVSPNNWAYEALRNLVDNYGCIVGYPDRTFRGDRALTRNEFAAGLSACLTQLEARMLTSRQQLGQFMEEKETSLAAGDTLENVFTRASYNSTGRFYDLTSISGQANKIFGWRSWPGSYFDNMIAEDAAVVEAVYHDALEQQTRGTVIHTRDLPEPFNQSLLEDWSQYTRFGNPTLPPTVPSF
ncbi:iron uptake porin [Synechocystis sp. PCC 6714]|uniref:iron uptake porin n=2 Tax=unclassified Synechocystis TaxID=2640012 RepID=UPI000491636D|nr:iron uptake porin [Synechocystis sp. PCC 6714]MCT0255198.1 iron uptake porin [Synechocystis sp. CS-94]